MTEQLIPIPRSIALTGGQTTWSVPSKVRRSDLRAQGYRLLITPTGITIEAADAAGEFYADQTLTQLKRIYPAAPPCIIIDDYPDFPTRGLLLDISRDKVPTVATLFGIVDTMAALKLNHLQLYTEHTFAYSGHETVWRDSSPMTPAEVRELDTYCRDRHIELVPNQNSFGHFERWLVHEEYADLAEAPDGFVWPNSKRNHGPFSLNPLDPRSLALLEDLYSQLLPNFSSRLFNVGCDETFDLGQSGTRSESACLERGSSTVYLEFLKKIHHLCQSHDRRMMFWADIIINSPQLVSALPSDVIALEWGYEADHPFAEHLHVFKNAGIESWVCPGTSSWLSFGGRTSNALANLQRAAREGLHGGATGYLITDWGDSGHLQYWSTSIVPIAIGAAVSWCVSNNLPKYCDQFSVLFDNFLEDVDLHVFELPETGLASWFSDLGEVYKAGRLMKNSTQLFRLLQYAGSETPPDFYPPTQIELAEQAREIDILLTNLTTSGSTADDAIAELPPDFERKNLFLTRDEAVNSAVMMRLVIDVMRSNANWSTQASNTPDSNTNDLDIGELNSGDTDTGDWNRQLWTTPPVPKKKLRRTLDAVLAEHRRLWLARNRPGGLSDSLAKLEKLRQLI